MGEVGGEAIAAATLFVCAKGPNKEKGRVSQASRIRCWWGVGREKAGRKGGKDEPSASVVTHDDDVLDAELCKKREEGWEGEEMR